MKLQKFLRYSNGVVWIRYITTSAAIALISFFLAYVNVSATGSDSKSVVFTAIYVIPDQPIPPELEEELRRRIELAERLNMEIILESKLNVSDRSGDVAIIYLDPIIIETVNESTLRELYNINLTWIVGINWPISTLSQKLETETKIEDLDLGYRPDGYITVAGFFQYVFPEHERHGNGTFADFYPSLEHLHIPLANNALKFAESLPITTNPDVGNAQQAPLAQDTKPLNGPNGSGTGRSWIWVSKQEFMGGILYLWYSSAGETTYSMNAFYIYVEAEAWNNCGYWHRVNHSQDYQNNLATARSADMTIGYNQCGTHFQAVGAHGVREFSPSSLISTNTEANYYSP